MTIRHFAAAAIMVATGTLAMGLPQAAAQDRTGAQAVAPLPHGWYVGGGYRYQYDGLGNFGHQVFFRDASGNFAPAHDPELKVTKHGPAGLLGYRFGDAALPAWLGANVRIDVSGWYLFGSASATSERPGRVTGFRTTRITGATNLAGIGGGESSTVAVRAVTEDWRLNLRMASDFPLSYNLLLTPSVTVLGGQTQAKFKQRYDDSIGQVNAVNARIDTDEIGGSVGAALTFKPTASLAFSLGGFVGLIHRSAHMIGSDCFSVGGRAAPCNPPPNGLYFGTSTAENRTKTAFIGGGEIGAAFSPADAWSVSLNGSITYDNGVATYRGPVPGATTGAQGTAAGVRFTSEIGYAVTARFALRF